MAVLPQQQQDQSTMNVLAPSGTQAPQQQPAAPNATPTLGAPSAVGGGTTAPQQQTPSSGLFTGINKYLAANQGAGQKVGQAIQQQTANQASNIGQAVQEKLGQYQTGINQAQQNVANAQQFGTGLISGIQGGQTNLTDAQIKQYQNAAQGLDLSGNALASAAPLNLTQQQQQAQTLQQQAQQAQTAGGTFNLLNQFFTTPTRQYTPGQQALDTTFLRRSPGALQQTQQAVQQAAGTATQNVAQAQQQGLEQQTALSEASKGLQETLAKQQAAAQTDLQNQLQQRAQTQIDTRDKMMAEINAAEQNGNLDITKLSAETRQALGIPVTDNLTPVDLQKLISQSYVSPEQVKAAQDYASQILAVKGTTGFNPYDYLTGTANINETPAAVQSMFATSEDLAKANALAQLAGNSAQTIITNPDLVGQGWGQGNVGGLGYNTQAEQDQANAILNAKLQATAQEYAAPGSSQQTANRESIWHDLAVGSPGGSAQQISQMNIQKGLDSGTLKQQDVDTYNQLLNQPRVADENGAYNNPYEIANDFLAQKMGFRDTGDMMYSGSFQLADQRARRNALMAMQNLIG